MAHDGGGGVPAVHNSGLREEIPGVLSLLHDGEGFSSREILSCSRTQHKVRTRTSRSLI